MKKVTAVKVKPKPAMPLKAPELKNRRKAKVVNVVALTPLLSITVNTVETKRVLDNTPCLLKLYEFLKRPIP